MLPNDLISQEVIKEFTITSQAKIPKHNKIDIKDFKIGYIVGSSGSGKSIMLKEYNTETHHKWTNAVCSNFKDYHQAKTRLLGAGLSSIPAWLKDYNVLSTGQKYRADLAIGIKDNAVFDEFTSVLDRDTAKGLACSISNYINQENITGIVFAGPHRDIIQYLKPDWVYDTDTRCLYTDKEPQQMIPFMEIT